MAVGPGDIVLYKLTANDIEQLNYTTRKASGLNVPGATILVTGVGRSVLSFPLLVTRVNGTVVSGCIWNEGGIPAYWVYDVILGTNPGQYQIKP